MRKCKEHCMKISGNCSVYESEGRISSNLMNETETWRMKCNIFQAKIVENLLANWQECEGIATQMAPVMLDFEGLQKKQSKLCY